MKFTKDVLYPGEWQLPDGRKWKASPELVAHLSQRAKDMLAAGLSIPLAWEHDDGAKPRTAAQKAADFAKTTPGYLESSILTAEGILEVGVEIPVDTDAKRMPAVRFASPEIISDFIDGTGRLWPGPSITHVAITPRPVQTPQKPFQPVAMSQGAVVPVRLSLAGFTPIRLGGSMADDNDDKKGDKGGEGKKGDKTGDATLDAGGKLKEVIEALSGDGYGFPEDTNPENFLERLHTAVLTKKASGAAGGGSVEPPVSDADNNPVVMSLTKRLMETERKTLAARAEALFSSGRISKPIKDKLVADLATVKLSMAPSTGELLPNSVVSRIEAYEAIEEGTVFPPVRLSDGEQRPPKPPEAANRPQNEREVEKRLDDWDATMGRKKKAAAQ